MVPKAVTAQVKYNERGGKYKLSKFNIRARGFYYCYFKVEGVGGGESGEGLNVFQDCVTCI